MIANVSLDNIRLDFVFCDSISSRHIDRYLKNDVSRSIVHMIKYANVQLYRVHPDGVIWKT